eukprot:4220817-Pyramimonas_sp.AAC.1
MHGFVNSRTLIWQVTSARAAAPVRTQFLWGENARALQCCSSRRQAAVSHGTLEAEIVSADEALRRELLPALPLWDMLPGRAPRAEFTEDNQAVVKVW